MEVSIPKFLILRNGVCFCVLRWLFRHVTCVIRLCVFLALAPRNKLFVNVSSHATGLRVLQEGDLLGASLLEARAR